MQSYALKETSNAEETEAYNEQLNAGEKMLPKEDMVIVTRELNAKVGFDSILLENFRRKYDREDRNGNGDRFGGTLAQSLL